ncbi:MAG TPA: PxKF domain-containing protein [Actinomycetota bacterium]|nr:PxKF domain-containing protein [Actinomycetota bacterium]
MTRSRMGDAWTLGTSVRARRRSRGLGFMTVLTAATVALSGIALADTVVVNDVVIGPGSTKGFVVTKGGPGVDVAIQIQGQGGDGGPSGAGGNCNATSASQITVALTGLPTGVSATPTSRSFSSCGTAQTITLAASTLASTGDALVTADATGGVGTTNDGTFTLRVEAPANTAPTTPGDPFVSAGTNPNNSGEFTLSWTASTDAESNPITYTLEHEDADDAGYSVVASGLTSPSYTFAGPSAEAEGTWVYRVRASDGSLSSGYSGASLPVVVDMGAPNAPTAAADRDPEYAGDGGWFEDTVTVSFTGNGDPDLEDGSVGSGVAAVAAAQTYGTSGSHTATGTASDAAGNVSAQASLMVQVDADGPSVAFTDCPAAPLILGSTAWASWQASDGESGLASAPSGSVPLDTSSVGGKSVDSPEASDNVGHTATATCTYSVIYEWTGFLRPVDNKDADGNYVLNVVKAGSAVPVKFKIGGDQGLDIFAQAGTDASGDPTYYPTSKTITCGSNADVDAIESVVTAGGSSLQYDASTETYTYVWKTDRGWAGTCRQLIVKLDDGTYHRANFKFTKS